MALTKEVAIDSINVVGEFKSVEVREATRILEGGAVLSKSYHRYVVQAGDDYSNLDQDVKDICALVHTPAIIAAFLARST